MFEEDEEQDPATTEASPPPAAGSGPLPDIKASTETAAPKGGNAAESKARLLSLSQVCSALIYVVSSFEGGTQCFAC